MKNLIVFISVTFLSFSALAQTVNVELNSVAAKEVGKLLRVANQKGDKSVKNTGGPQVTSYAVGNLVCDFQNSDDSVSCSVSSEVPVQRNVDDLCITGYSQEANRRCNSSTENDDGKLAACLLPLKETLKECCQQPGATAQCGADVK